MTRDELNEILEQQLSKFTGQVFRHVSQRVDELRDEMNARFDRAATTMDGIAKRLDNDDKERAATIVEQNRHQKWIGQLAHATGTELIPEQ